MVTIDIRYQGDLRCHAVHGPSGRELPTDAPVDNHGKGESFSPTDLVATGIGTCMMTILGIRAAKDRHDLAGSTVRVVKHMSSDAPRRIVRLEVDLALPDSLDEATRAAYEDAARHCPVAMSIDPAIAVDLRIDYVPGKTGG